VPVTTLDRYVLRELSRNLALALLGLLLVFSLGAVLSLARAGVTWGQLGRALPFALLFTLPWALPFALLIATVTVLGRLVADREVVALEASGVPARTVRAPFVAVAAALSLLSLVLQTEALPLCHRRVAEIRSSDVEEVFALGEGRNWSRSFGKGFDVHVARHAGKELEGVVLHKDAGTRPLTLAAERGRVRHDRALGNAVLDLEDLSVTVFEGVGSYARSPLRLSAARATLAVPLAPSVRARAGDLTSSELRALRSDARLKAGAELSQRAVLALMPLAFVLLALPVTLALGARGPLVALVAATGACVVFFLAPLVLGVTLAQRLGGGELWPYIACAVAAPAALVLDRLRLDPA
jgi:lipopolysaccharide export LptBFGC system permease protein LptF